MSWIQADVDTVARLWAEGLSASEIVGCLTMKKTRNAVIGKVHRLGLSGMRRGAGRTCPRKRVLTPTPPTQPKPARKVSVLASLPTTPLPAEDIRPTRTIALVDLEEHHCRYPYGAVHDASIGFCGKDHVEGLAYCADHARKCFVIPPVKERERVKAISMRERVNA